MQITDEVVATVRSDIAKAVEAGTLPHTTALHRSGDVLVVSGVGDTRGFLSPTLCDVDAEHLVIFANALIPVCSDVQAGTERLLNAIRDLCRRPVRCTIS